MDHQESQNELGFERGCLSWSRQIEQQQQQQQKKKKIVALDGVIDCFGLELWIPAIVERYHHSLPLDCAEGKMNH